MDVLIKKSFNVTGSEELWLLTSLQSGRRRKPCPFLTRRGRNLQLICNSFEAVELNVHSWRAGRFAVLRPDCNGDLRTKTENICWQVWMEELESSLELPAADFWCL